MSVNEVDPAMTPAELHKSPEQKHSTVSESVPHSSRNSIAAHALATEILKVIKFN